ncbi:DUF6752 domain-containing protein [Nocardioides sediminis]|jgi:uncharacterized coiled-coil protein SlyX|uniref:DUF6752 domain-containing protein n=1 Tax=Nocardioides sediminis TaxID=433648 RepID=UPI000D3068B4|nr:DUF6752 domain-containing protein [Nocardioides sediminis]
MRLRSNDGGRKDLEARVDALEATVASLEERVAEGQALHQRFAELLDVVTELMVPLAQRDEESAALVRRYVDELGS